MLKANARVAPIGADKVKVVIRFRRAQRRQSVHRFDGFSLEKQVWVVAEIENLEFWQLLQLPSQRWPVHIAKTKLSSEVEGLQIGQGRHVFRQCVRGVT